MNEEELREYLIEFFCDPIDLERAKVRYAVLIRAGYKCEEAFDMLVHGVR